MPKNQTIKALLNTNTSRLASTLIEDNSAFFEANLLLQHMLNVNRAWLISHENTYLTPENAARFEILINKRIAGEPIAYILGEREFYGLNLKVTPDTLIPRPDTETLVEATLAKIAQNDHHDLSSIPQKRESILGLTLKTDSCSQKNDGIKLLDLGTGTGAIALAISKHRPQAQVTAVDASESALKIAQENAELLGITNITFVQSNWFAELKNKTFDLIVSNPPYIVENDPHLSQGDLRFEPRTALASGTDGLDDIRHIISHASKHLNAHGWLMLEHGYNQAKEVADLFAMAEFKNIQHVEDLAGIQRVTIGSI